MEDELTLNGYKYSEMLGGKKREEGPHEIDPELKKNIDRQKELMEIYRDLGHGSDLLLARGKIDINEYYRRLEECKTIPEIWAKEFPGVRFPLLG